MEVTNNEQYDIVPTHLVVQAMRDNGYKNAAYAIAELMDNSIQAEATLVELLCGEEEEVVSQRSRKRLKQIAVLDNGLGMDNATLRMALQFGNGTHLESSKQNGIGRFGMGLPASSISQCKRVEVWSWQDGVENALYSYLDIDEIKNRNQSSVPSPISRPIPTLWLGVGEGFSRSGTLVVWSHLDRCMWKSASAVIDNSELLIGRMYRRFLNESKVRIRLAAFRLDAPAQTLNEREALPNDPGYLMAHTSCPSPYHNVPMFEPYGEEHFERTVTINFRDQNHEVKLRFSLAKQEARLTDNAGNLPYGKHAGKNIGISLVRADRELDLDQAMVIQYDPRERWWGVEVDFPPALDDLFGVTNNKQAARNFTNIASLDTDAFQRDGRTPNDIKAELASDGDPAAILLDITQPIQSHLSQFRRLIKAQTKGTRSTDTRHQNTPEETATARTKERQQEGHTGQSDMEEKMSVDQRKEAIHDSLIDEGVAEKEAEELAGHTVDNGLKYVFAKADLQTSAFFSVKLKGGAMIITLNTSHPAYDNLVDILEEDVEGVEASELRDRLTKALGGLKLLLTAWARYEDEEPDGNRRIAAQETRNDWGRIAWRFLNRMS